MGKLDNDGDTAQVQGSGARPYEQKNVGGVLSCSCPAWRNQSRPIDLRTCKHIVALQGAEVERSRVGDDNMPTKFRNGSGTAAATGGTRNGPSGRSVGPSSPSPAAAGSGPALLLANKWTADVDPEGWWLSEKLDGIRAYWDGRDFFSRNGNVFHAPDWFRATLPRSPLDGELWLGRQEFQRTMSIVRSHNGGDRWNVLKYVVFDAPKEGGGFEARMERLQEWFGDERCDYAQLHPHQLCVDADHLKAELDRILALQGEGLMLRKPGSSYEGRRSSTLLKVKRFIEAEAVIVDHVAGKGKHRGRLGGLIVEMPDGKRFNVGSGLSDALRKAPPTVGTTITYRFTEHTKDGIPKCASFVRVRIPE